MNRICRRIEEEFDGESLGFQDIEFDATLLKSGCVYSSARYEEIAKIYGDYQRRMKDLAIASSNRRESEKDSLSVSRDCIKREFVQRCDKACPNKFELCDIVIDMCYTTNQSKQFAWDVCGATIIENLQLKEIIQ